MLDQPTGYLYSTSMPEEHDKHSDDFIDALDSELDEASPYARTISTFEESQHDFIDAAAKYFSEPTEENRIIVAPTANVVARRFVNCYEYIRTNVADETEQKASIAQLILEEEERHLAVFTELFPSALWDVNRYKREDVQESIQKVFDNADDEESLTACLTQIFLDGVQADLSTLFSRVVPIEESEVQNPLDVRNARLRAIGKHILDVAKLSAGVAAGILIAKSFRQK